MARKVNVRTQVNRAALGAITSGVVDTLEQIGERFKETVHPPDATPYGIGLVTTPDYGVWVRGKKVAGTAAKPRSVRLRNRGEVLICGEGFPGRFQELGTVKMHAQPHVTPVMLQVIPQAKHDVKPSVLDRLRRVR